MTILRRVLTYDFVPVMYLGRIVALEPVAQVFGQPARPYTAALFGSVPKLVVGVDELVRFNTIEGELLSPLSPPSRCSFHPRYPLTSLVCGSTQAASGVRSVA